jgi:Leucine-rich repeat (LRR) protein
MKLKNTLKAFGLGIILTAVLGIGIANPIRVYAADEVAIDETNFPDSVFRSYVETNFDTDGNGVLSSEEINAVTSIENSTEKYSSLQGIEYFTKLTSLVCSDNKLTKLNVSKNTKLTYLECSNNKLTKLDVSKNTKLTMLGCAINKLTALDISKNTKLTDLYCYKNKITKLDLSKNKKLTFVHCSNNKITKLDIRKNTKLETLVYDGKKVKVTKSKNSKCSLMGSIAG